MEERVKSLEAQIFERKCQVAEANIKSEQAMFLAGELINRFATTKPEEEHWIYHNYQAGMYLSHLLFDLIQSVRTILDANIDLPICLALVVPDFIYTAPAVGPMSSVRRYRDGRARHFIVVKMRVEQVEHFFGFLYDFRYLQHGCVLLKVMFDVSDILRTTGEKATGKASKHIF